MTLHCTTTTQYLKFSHLFKLPTTLEFERFKPFKVITGLFSFCCKEKPDKTHRKTDYTICSFLESTTSKRQIFSKVLRENVPKNKTMHWWPLIQHWRNWQGIIMFRIMGQNLFKNGEIMGVVAALYIGTWLGTWELEGSWFKFKMRFPWARHQTPTTRLLGATDYAMAL